MLLAVQDSCLVPVQRLGNMPTMDQKFGEQAGTFVRSGGEQTMGSEKPDIRQASHNLGSSSVAPHAVDTTPTLDDSMWSYPGGSDFKLRGKKYLSGDKKKVPCCVC